MQPITRVSSSSSLDSVSSPQEGKRYARDYPDSYKWSDKYGRVHIKDSEGYELVVSGAIVDRLVLEDSSETRLQKLVRRCVLMGPTLAAWNLQKEIVAEFGEEAVGPAIQKVGDECHNLHSPEVRAFTELGMQAIAVQRKINRWNEENTYIGADGLRHSNHLPNRATFLDVVQETGRGVVTSYRSFRRNHPAAITAAKVSAFFLGLFFLSTKSSSQKPLFL